MSDKLQKLLAHAGYGSRRELETWISDGRVTVNGKRAKLGDRADATDRVLIDGKMARLTIQQKETIKALVYHKPEGEICTRNDPKGRPTVFENLPAIPGGRWVSVGRLDINTSGLILFTNNGELANKLMHPSTGLEREYLVRIRGAASQDTITTLTREGVQVDGKPAKFDSVVPADMSEEAEALTMSDRVAVFNDGRIQQLASPGDLYERPENSFVAQFIGENNKLSATVIARNGDVAQLRLENGATCEALAVNCGDVGQDTLISIRPERVQIGGPEAANTTDGKVQELIYLGDHIRCRLNVHGNDEFIVKVPNAAGHTHLSVGETTRVTWATEDARALDLL